VTFDGYTITTTNPGNMLLVVTVFMCIFCFFIGLLVFPNSPLSPLYKHLLGKIDWSGEHSETSKTNTTQTTLKQNHTKGPQQNQYVLYNDKNDDDSELTDRYKVKKKKALRGKKRYGRVSTSDSMRKVVKISVNRPTSPKFSKGLKGSSVKSVASSSSGGKKTKITVKTKQAKIGRYEENLQFEDYFIWQNSISKEIETENDDSVSVISDTTFTGHSVLTDFDESVDSAGNKILMEREMKKILGLLGPWIMQALAVDTADLLQMMLISHFMGLGDMICYSNVWFLLGTVQMISSAWQGSAYKHFIAAVAQESSDGNRLAGQYLQLATNGTILLMLPVTLIISVWMPTIMDWFGYDDEIVEISRYYVIVAAINQLIDYVGYNFSALLEIQGYAKFNAIFDFWESLVGLVSCGLFIVLFRPSLLVLGIFHLLLDITGTIYYMYLTFEKNGWFEQYHDGMVTPMQLSMLEPMKSMARKTLPLTLISLEGYVHSILLTIFASYQGAAEAATWILLSYVWEFVEMIPLTFASAVTNRVEHNLGRNNLLTSKNLAFRALKICTILSIFCSIVLIETRFWLVWLLSLDGTLETMILEIIPYIAICQPFITIGTTASYMNEAIGIYYKAVSVDAIISICITIPFAAINTYLFNYNIEGLASAICVGYTAIGVTNIVIFMNVDWERAAYKMKKLGLEKPIMQVV